jgi:mycothiol synthase
MNAAGVEIQVCEDAMTDADLNMLFDACVQGAEGLDAPGADAVSRWRVSENGPESPLVLAVADDTPVGIGASGMANGDGLATLRFLGVSIEERGKGVGTLLESHLSDLAKGRGYRKLRTGFSLDSRNETAARFLDKQGWIRNTDAGLRMWRNLNDLPEVEVPSGYSLRSFESGDEGGFVEVKNAAFSGEHAGGRDWTVADFEKEYLRSPLFRAERIFFAVCDGELVGTTTAWTAEFEGREVGLIHWVAVVPEHRGKGLGWLLNVQALHKLKEMGYEECVLSTNESLSSAVRLYGRLGFQIVTKRSTYTKLLL